MERTKLYYEAWDFAVRAHHGQRYGAHPYCVHLDQVAAVAEEFLSEVEDVEFLAACFLHDTVEDTDVTLQYIESGFGARVAQLVGAVTCVKGLRRSEKFKEAYPRIRATEGAVLLKLCDRIANVRSCYDTRSPLILMYGKEYPEFRRQLKDQPSGAAAPLWDELDRLLGFSLALV